MVTDFLLFIPLALIAIVSAIGMIISKNAMYSALNLIVNFGTVAVFYLILGAQFIALTQITVYAGAIMVLFLFVIMLLGTESLPTSNVLRWQRPVAIILAVLLAGEAVYLLFARGATAGVIPPPIESFGSPQGVGRALFNQYLLPFEITSVLLLVAMVGAIVLTRKEKVGR